jgi:RNA polymerase sigma-70 factor (ECF subfamily)
MAGRGDCLSVSRAVVLPGLNARPVSDARAATDDRAGTFERLLREHGAALERLAAAYEREPSDRQDLMQEIAFAIWRALPTFRGACSERTFVFRIGHNRAITHRTRGRARGARFADAADVDAIPDAGPDPDAAMAAADARERLRVAVRRLTPALREAVVLTLEGLSPAEVAEVLGVGAGTVAVRLTRARAVLARLLSPEGTP